MKQLEHSVLWNYAEMAAHLFGRWSV